MKIKWQFSNPSCRIKIHNFFLLFSLPFLVEFSFRVSKDRNKMHTYDLTADPLHRFFSTPTPGGFELIVCMSGNQSSWSIQS
jgi:hypothetical protein